MAEKADREVASARLEFTLGAGDLKSRDHPSAKHLPTIHRPAPDCLVPTKKCLTSSSNPPFAKSSFLSLPLLHSAIGNSPRTTCNYRQLYFEVAIFLTGATGRATSSDLYISTAQDNPAINSAAVLASNYCACGPSFPGFISSALWMRDQGQG